MYTNFTTPIFQYCSDYGAHLSGRAARAATMNDVSTAYNTADSTMNAC